MSLRKIAFEAPALKIFEGKDDYEGYKDGDVIAIAYESKNHGTLYRLYTLGSVVGYAIENCECPFEEVERAKEHGHQLHWANQNAVTITSGPVDQKRAFMQAHGDTIKFHGKHFEIVATPNDNIALR